MEVKRENVAGYYYNGNKAIVTKSWNKRDKKSEEMSINPDVITIWKFNGYYDISVIVENTPRKVIFVDPEETM